MTTLSEFSATSINGSPIPLSTYDGQVVLVVNTASKCGYTPQYRGLEDLWRGYRDRGLVVLGFPCDQFGHQEPGSEEEIADFCELNYGVSFPLFAKVDVNGDGAHPLFSWLKEEGEPGGNAIEWNFTKFLVGRDGRVLRRYPPKTTPDALAPDIEAALG